MKKLLLFTLLIASTAIMAQPQLSWRCNNFQLINGDTQLQFDVEVQADIPGEVFGLTTVAFDYSEIAFGQNIIPGSVTVERGALLQTTYTSPAPPFNQVPKYNIIGVANTFPTTMSAGIQSASLFVPNTTTYEEIPTTWGQFFIFTIDILPGAPAGTTSGIVLNEVLMNGQSFYIIPDPLDPTVGTNAPTVNPSLYDNNGITEFVVVPGGAGTPGLWTGAVSDDWFDGGNWDDGLVPDALVDVNIPAGTPNDPVIETDDVLLQVAVANSVNNDATLTIMPFGFLSTNAMTNNGSVMMMTNATDQASLICSSFAGTGSYTYDRYLGINTALPEAERGWHYISSPVPGFSSHNMYDYYINTWDEATSLWVQHPGVGWPDCIPAAEMFNNGTDGWSVKLDEGYGGPYSCGTVNPPTGMNVEFIGTPNAGNIVQGMTYTGAGTYPGFNLVGNPYPSYWNYDDFWAGANWPAGLFDAIYYWDESTNQYASYVNGIGTNGGGPFVPPAQAFFFEMDGSQPTADVTFDDVDRTHVYGLPYYKDAENLVKLMASANGFTDETVIRFGEDFTTARDHADARKLMSGGTTVPSLYTMASNIAISINGMPATETVPVFFECATSGTYTIEAIETSDFSYLALEDLLTGTLTNLLEDSYTFEHSEEADPARFVLHFNSLGIGDNAANAVSIWSNENKVYVQTETTDRGDIVVYNMMGQEVVRTDINPGMNIIPMQEVNTYYVVKVLTNDKAVTGKVYIK